MFRFKLQTHQRANAGRDSNQLQDEGVIKQVVLGEPKNRPAFTGGPDADERQPSDNANDYA